MNASRIPTIVLTAFLTLLSIAAATIVWPFVTALLWALSLGILVLPYHRRLSKKYSPGIASMGATLMVLFTIFIPMLIVSSLAYAQLQPALSQMEGSGGWETAEKVDAAIHPLMEKIGFHDFHLKEWWELNGPEITKGLKEPVGKFVKQLGLGIFTFVVAMLAMFFMLKDGKGLREPFLKFCSLPRNVAEGLLNRVERTVHAVFVSTVMVAVLQGLVMGITFAALGVPNAVLLGVVSVVLCIIPMLGAPVLYVPVALLFLAQGESTKAIIVLIVGFAIVSNIDNALKPFIIGSQVALNPIAIFVSVLGGIAVFGPIGLMVGPMVLTIILGLYDYADSLQPMETPPAPKPEPEPISSGS